MPGRILHESDLFALGEFRLAPGSPQWSVVNCIGAGHHVVFPRTPVRIRHGGSEEIVADPNLAVMYEPFQEYRRGVLDERGDRCTYVVLSSSLHEDLWGDRTGGTHRPAPARAYLLQRLVSDLAHEGAADPLLVDEVVIGALTEVAGAPAPRPRAGVVEDARAVLAVRYADRMTLADLAGAVFVSPFHLARTFRAQTGSSIHAYRTSLRLRAALDMLREGQSTIAQVAAACGFSSHGHLTGAFRRAFGATPSKVRRPAPELSTFLQAALATCP